MVGGVQADLGTQKHIVSDGDRGAVEHDAVEVRKEMGAEVDIASELAPERRLEAHLAAHRSHDPTQQGLAFLSGPTVGTVVRIGGPDGLDPRCDELWRQVVVHRASRHMSELLRQVHADRS